VAIHCFSIILVRRGNEHPFLVLKTSFSFAIFAICLPMLEGFHSLDVIWVVQERGVWSRLLRVSGHVFYPLCHTPIFVVCIWEVCSLGIVYADPVPDEVGWGL